MKMEEKDVLAKHVEILKKIGEYLIGEAKKLCPLDMGHLRNSISCRVDGDSVTIFSPLDYAEDMEYGKPPEPLSGTEKEDVREWAKRHKIKNAEGVIRNLEHRGIRVGTVESPMHITSFRRNSYRPFLRPAIHRSHAGVNKIIMQGLMELSA